MFKALVLDKEKSKFNIEDRPPIQPESDEVLVKHLSIGLNDQDIYDFYDDNGPQILGYEGCGTIVSIGSNVDNWSEGDEVVYLVDSPGSFSQMRCVKTKNLVRKPPDIDHKVVSAIFLKGMLAHAVTARAFVLREGLTVLVHDICNSTAQIIVQFAKSRGARVIGSVASEEMMERASRIDCDLIVNNMSDDFVKEVIDFTNGKGVHGVYENIAKRMMQRSVNCLGKFGMLICYGQAMESIPYGPLASKSLFFTAPSVFDYKQVSKSELVLTASDIFQAIREKKISTRYRECNFLQVLDAITAVETGKIDDSIVILP